MAKIVDVPTVIAEAEDVDGPDPLDSEFTAREDEEPPTPEQERDALVARLRQLQEQEPEPTTPFELSLMFRNGHEETYDVTTFEPTIVNGRIVAATWSQNHAVPGDRLLQWIDWGEVIRVWSASIDQRPRRKR